jgi:hypothetical protein
VSTSASPSLEDLARWRRMADAAPASGMVWLRARSLIGLLDALEALRREVGAAVALARAEVHPGHTGPCTSGLDHPTPHDPDCDTQDVDPAIGRATKPCNCRGRA